MELKELVCGAHSLVKSKEKRSHKMRWPRIRGGIVSHNQTLMSVKQRDNHTRKTQT